MSKTCIPVASVGDVVSYNNKKCQIIYIEESFCKGFEDTQCLAFPYILWNVEDNHVEVKVKDLRWFEENTKLVVRYKDIREHIRRLK